MTFFGTVAPHTGTVSSKKQAAKVMAKCRGNGSSLPAPLLKFAEMKIAEDREKGNNFAGKTERGRERMESYLGP